MTLLGRLFAKVDPRPQRFDFVADWDQAILDAREQAAGRYDAPVVDPATLRVGGYQPHDGHQVCYCGHLRAAHRTRNYWDGTCIVEGCEICKSSGYLNGTPIEEPAR